MGMSSGTRSEAPDEISFEKTTLLSPALALVSASLQHDKIKGPIAAIVRQGLVKMGVTRTGIPTSNPVLLQKHSHHARLQPMRALQEAGGFEDRLCCRLVASYQRALFEQAAFALACTLPALLFFSPSHQLDGTLAGATSNRSIRSTRNAHRQGPGRVIPPRSRLHALFSASSDSSQFLQKHFF